MKKGISTSSPQANLQLERLLLSCCYLRNCIVLLRLISGSFTNRRLIANKMSEYLVYSGNEISTEFDRNVNETPSLQWE